MLGSFRSQTETGLLGCLPTCERKLNSVSSQTSTFFSSLSVDRVAGFTLSAVPQILLSVGQAADSLSVGHAADFLLCRSCRRFSSLSAVPQTSLSVGLAADISLSAVPQIFLSVGIAADFPLCRHCRRFSFLSALPQISLPVGLAADLALLG